MTERAWSGADALNLLFFGSVATAMTAAVSHGCARNPTASQAEAPATASPPPPAAGPAEDRIGLGRVARDATSAVVSVASTHEVEAEVPNLPFDDPFFRRFFGPGLGQPFPAPPGSRPQPRQGLGSGVLVGDGVVLTNAHVVKGAKSLIVTAQGRRNLEVELAGVDAKSDLAALRVKSDTSGLSKLQFADSDAAYPGQVVLAIGNPFGVGETVTMGIVSAKGRADLGIADYEDFIQTDAAINPGNSGGALVDLNGRLLGIPTAILSRTGGYMGVGFAIPSNMARPIMKALLESGRVVRGYLGVTIQNVDRDLASALGLKETRGVLVSEVEAGSPSAKAGLSPGDVILAVDGQNMHTTGQLRNSIAAAGDGKEVALEVWRDGKALQLNVTLASMPNEAEPVVSPSDPTKKASTMGLTVAPLDASKRRQLNVPDSIKAGVVVAGVAPASKAFDAGLRSGDIIVELARKPVTAPNELTRLWRDTQGTVAVLVFRDGRSRYLAMKH